MLELMIFGTWSLACVFAGAWLQHRKQIDASPLPTNLRRWEQEHPDGEPVAPVRKGKL